MEDINWNRLSRERENEKKGEKMRVEVGVKGQDKEFENTCIYAMEGGKQLEIMGKKYYNKEGNKESRRHQKREFQGHMDGP